MELLTLDIYSDKSDFKKESVPREAHSYSHDNLQKSFTHCDREQNKPLTDESQKCIKVKL